MIKDTNCYSNNDAVSMARKIARLQELKVPFELKIAKGIAGENVVMLSWDHKVFEDAIENEEEF